MKIENMINCQFQNWYPIFKHCTFKSKIHKLGPEFIDYLREDGIIIDPKYITKNDQLNDISDDENEEIKERSKDSESVEEIKEIIRVFPDIEKVLVEAVENYDAVFAKLNWSAPKDTDGWVPQLKVQNMEQLLYVLKGSYFIHHDIDEWFTLISLFKIITTIITINLSKRYKECEDCAENKKHEIEYYLVLRLIICFFIFNMMLLLRKWYSLNSSMEFRCFVFNNELIALSQRNLDGYFPFYKEQEKEIKEKIHNFFIENIKSKFPDQNFVFDIYIDIPPKQRVWLVDFNAWGSSTDPLLFSWDELNNWKSMPETSASIVFKYHVSSDMIKDKGLGQYKVPLEMIDQILLENTTFQDLIGGNRSDLYQN